MSKPHSWPIYQLKYYRCGHFFRFRLIYQNVLFNILSASVFPQLWLKTEGFLHFSKKYSKCEWFCDGGNILKASGFDILSVSLLRTIFFEYSKCESVVFSLALDSFFQASFFSRISRNIDFIAFCAYMHRGTFKRTHTRDCTYFTNCWRPTSASQQCLLLETVCTTQKYLFFFTVFCTKHRQYREGQALQLAAKIT